MNKCALCEKKMDNQGQQFGLSCLKKICFSVGIDEVKNYQGERLLNKDIQKICHKISLSKDQNQLLTNRYLALKLLEEVDLEEYDKYKKLLEKEIYGINSDTTPDSLKSFKKISLKQANEVNKYYKKYKTLFQKIKDGDYDAAQYISSGVIRFAFSSYYMKKPYLSDMLQRLQRYILKVGVLYFQMRKWPFAAECLNHALQENPSDKYIVDQRIIQKIKNSSSFKKYVKDACEKNRNKRQFTAIGSIKFENGDLFWALHQVQITLNASRKTDDWKLNINIEDIYDFTELKKLQDYTGKKFMHDLLASTGNNLALIATNCKVVSKYKIIIEFDYEVSGDTL